MTVEVVTPSQNRAIFQSDGVVITPCDSRNAAIGRGRNGALTIVVVTPSQNRAIFQSDGVVVTARDSRNAAIGRGRNVALIVVVITPLHHTHEPEILNLAIKGGHLDFIRSTGLGMDPWQIPLLMNAF